MTRRSDIETRNTLARRPLSALQQNFVEEYLIDFNGTRAAERAGYSSRSASTMASRLLSHPQISLAIAEGIEARAARTRVTADRVIDEYARIAFSDMRRYVEWGSGGVALKASSAIDVVDAACVAEVTETKTATGGTVKFKLHDKRAALDALAKHLGLFVERGDKAMNTGPDTAIVNVNIERES
jgi:phage terminase small subunit